VWDYANAHPDAHTDSNPHADAHSDADWNDQLRR
jgi:hypothetical protein